MSLLKRGGVLAFANHLDSHVMDLTQAGDFLERVDATDRALDAYRRAHAFRKAVRWTRMCLDDYDACIGCC